MQKEGEKGKVRQGGRAENKAENEYEDKWIKN